MEEKITQQIPAAAPISVRGMTTGEVAYHAYATSTGGKTFDGRQMPKWKELPESIRAAWSAAADAVRSLAPIEAIEHAYEGGRCLCGRPFHRGL